MSVQASFKTQINLSLPTRPCVESCPSPHLQHEECYAWSFSTCGCAACLMAPAWALKALKLVTCCLVESHCWEDLNRSGKKRNMPPLLTRSELLTDSRSPALSSILPIVYTSREQQELFSILRIGIKSFYVTALKYICIRGEWLNGMGKVFWK